jgi:SRSO17 transposase
LLVDESGFEKQGDASAGVARQYNGRLGKVENSQVGVYAALACGALAAIIDFDLFLPRDWVADAARCEKAGIPESARVFRSKPHIAAEMVKRARAAGVRFGFIGADGLYGNATWLLFDWDTAGEVFATEVHVDQRFHFADPGTAWSPEWEAREWAAGLKRAAWQTVILRDGEKGEVRALFASTRVWISPPGSAPDSAPARQWHLLARRDGKKVKFMLSNAAPDTPLAELARMQALRPFIEHAFEDAKGCCGMADYQVRKWRAWHNHMALVAVALLFLVKERRLHSPYAWLLSCADVVDLLLAQLPVKIEGYDDMVRTLAERHQRRKQARDSAYRRQPPAPKNAIRIL